jgi:mRNA interferase YafQ
MQKRGKDMRKLRMVLLLLINEEQLSASYKDHPLKGEWNTFRDLHVETDWILIYRVAGDELELARTGTHADLFYE